MKLESSIWLDPNRVKDNPATDQENHTAPFLHDDVRFCFILSYLLLNMTDSAVSLKNFLLRLEKDIIEHALQMCKGNQKRAASLLTVKETTLSEKMSRFGLRQH